MSKETRPGIGASAAEGAFSSGDEVVPEDSGVWDERLTWERVSKCDSRNETGF